jgi:predicted hotdog family 3-hydroxylacyl-ACP dehydratase
MLVTKKELYSYIPQQYPFVMVDSLIFSEGNISRTTFTPSNENVLVENGLFSEAGIIENIAQSAALQAGFSAKRNNGPIKIGYIGAIKNLEITNLPKIGQTIETEIVIENQILDASIVKGYVKLDGNMIASCEMRIFLKDPIPAN